MGVPQEGSDQAFAIGALASSRSMFLPIDNKCRVLDRSDQDCGSGNQDGNGCTSLTCGSVIGTGDTAHWKAMLVDFNGAWCLAVTLSNWSNDVGQDPLGFRPVRISIAGETYGRSQAIQARPARWPCIRRLLPQLMECTSGDPLTGLGIAIDYQCEAWECYYSGTNQENLHLERIFRGNVSAMRARNMGSNQQTHTYNSCERAHIQQIGTGYEHGRRHNPPGNGQWRPTRPSTPFRTDTRYQYYK